VPVTGRPPLADRSPSYVFGRFRLSGDGTLLTRDGATVPLAPKVLQTLLALVERAGDVVTKAELLQSIWPDSFIEDTGLTRNISVLRNALRDEGRQLIVTVPRIGYRFVGTVERQEAPATPARSDAQLGSARERCDVRSRRGNAIVGREKERALLHAAFAGARDGSGRCVAVTGEPGIGKTTVVEEFLSEVSEPCRVACGRCSERLAGAEPHLPVLEAIDSLIADDPVLASWLRRVAPTWYVHVVPREDEPPSVGRSPEGALAGSAERLMRELTAFLEEVSRDRPLVIFIEDVHWSDESTVDVIAHLAARAGRMAVLLIVTYRPHELTVSNHPFQRLSGELIARGELAELRLDLLTSPDVTRYVRASFADHGVAWDLPAFVYQRTEGNALFMVELVRYLQEHGASSGPPDVAGEVPGSLRGMIERTVELLDRGSRELLDLAAVHGYEFESAILARVAGRDPADVEERLQSLDRVHGLVTVDREHTLPDGSFSMRYRFVHVLYQNSLFSSIAPTRRSDAARRIAESLASAFGSRTDTIAGELAALFEMGRDFWQASTYLLAASRSATRRFAFREASELARRGLACLDAPGVNQQLDARRREFDLTFARLIPLASVEGYASSEIEQLTNRLLQLGEGLREATVTSAALGATWVVRMVRGDCRAAKDAGVRMVAEAKTADDKVMLMNGHMQAMIACHHLGEFREAQHHADSAIALERHASPSERCLTILDPVVASLAESSRNLWIMGYLARCLEHNDQAVAVGREIRHPDSLAFAWVFRGWIHGYRRDWTTCLAAVEAGIAVASESGSVQTLAWNRGVRGWALAHTGHVDAGLAELTAAIEASRSIMGQVAMPQFGAMVGEILLLRGDVASAERSISQALELSYRQFDRYFDAELHRLSATCLLARGQREPALDRLRTAIDVARSQSAATFELRAALELATHEPVEGVSAVRSALATYPEPEGWPDIEMARKISEREG
jgi:DNA-binding winged helix-turn-helix (wHTH) protein/tetratricopeptide (TPR) repeat protein